jgi:translation initiation factor IF-1
MTLFNPWFSRGNTALGSVRAEVRLQILLAFLRISFFYRVSTLFMGSEQPIELEGTVRTVLPGTMFRVILDNQHEVLAHMSGKMRKHFVRLTVGDRVRLEMSPYDLSKARITYRLR